MKKGILFISLIIIALILFVSCDEKIGVSNADFGFDYSSATFDIIDGINVFYAKYDKYKDILGVFERQQFREKVWI